MAHRKTQHRIQEFTLIRAIERRFARETPQVVQGIGDDASVFAVSTPKWWHVTTDLLAEAVHFDLSIASPESVGYRAAMANLSDIAAMGAVPRYMLTSIAVPNKFTARHTYKLYQGLMNACCLHNVILVGGDTSASKTGLFLSITLIGTTTKGRALFRRGAHVGDLIYVTGTLGDSLAGLQLLIDDKKTHSPPSKPTQLPRFHRRFLIDRHLHPNARIAEGQWLNTARLATSAIDLSDGLSGDLQHICEESRVGVELDLSKIPISPACRSYAKNSHLQPIQFALTGGEDYELLFTIPRDKQATVERQARNRRYQVTCIGTVRPRQFGIKMRSVEGHLYPIPMTSYEHFR